MALESVAEFISPPLGSKPMHVRRVYAHSRLGRLYEVRLELLRETGDLVTARQLLGLHAGVKIPAALDEWRHVNGIVTEFERGGQVGSFDIYRLTLRPWLWQLTLTADCRIFQEKTAVEILDEIFAEYGAASKVEKKLEGSFAKRPYTVQYRESDFNFVSRLMEQEGIYYYFKHEDDRHTLVLCNGLNGHADGPVAELHWSPSLKDDKERLDIVTHWNRSHLLQPLKTTLNDFAAESPTTSLLASSAVRSAPYPKPSAQYKYEIYDYPGGHDDLAMTSVSGKVQRGKSAADVLNQRHETAHSLVEALTSEPMIALGQTFTFKGHPEDDGRYLVSATVQALEYTGYEAGEEATETAYECRFDAVPASVKYQPPPAARPVTVTGSQTATVTGKSGDEIHTDKYGRVKVRFHWDRRGQSDETASCWVRVSQPWASKGFGFVALPRVGDEVVVDFLEGDPDRPLITGRVYNGDNMPPWELPAQATVSGVRTRSSKQGSATTFNELRFDDKKGSEYIWFQAEKDFHHRIKHDATLTVDNDRSTKIGNNDTLKVVGEFAAGLDKSAKVKVGVDTHLKIGGDLNAEVGGATGLKSTGEISIKGDAALKVTSGAATDLKVGAGLNVTATGAVHIKGLGVVIDGGTQLCIKAGGAFILLGPEGVTIQGTLTKVNSGGAGGNANAAAAASPAAPAEPAEPPAQQDPISGGGGGGA